MLYDVDEMHRSAQRGVVWGRILGTAAWIIMLVVFILAVYLVLLLVGGIRGMVCEPDGGGQRPIAKLVAAIKLRNLEAIGGALGYCCQSFLAGAVRGVRSRSLSSFF